MTMRERGTVIHALPGRGYGFIKPDLPGARDVFCHVNGLRGGGRDKSMPNEGSRVEYRVEIDPKIKRERATDIVVLKEEAKHG